MDQGLSEIKSIIKSLIVSSPKGMTIDTLNRDYREIVGEYVPYAKFGFSTLEKFLKSIPDALSVCGSGSDASLFAICSEKMQHINEMVCNQKSVTRIRKSMVVVESKNSDISPSVSSSISTLKKKCTNTASSKESHSKTLTAKEDTNHSVNKEIASSTLKKPVAKSKKPVSNQQSKLNFSVAPPPPAKNFVQLPNPSISSQHFAGQHYPQTSNQYKSFQTPRYHPQNPSHSYYNQQYNQYYGNQRYYPDQYWSNIYNPQWSYYDYNNSMLNVQPNMNQYFNNNSNNVNDNNVHTNNQFTALNEPKPAEPCSTTPDIAQKEQDIKCLQNQLTLLMKEMKEMQQKENKKISTQIENEVLNDKKQSQKDFTTQTDNILPSSNAASNRKDKQNEANKFLSKTDNSSVVSIEPNYGKSNGSSLITSNVRTNEQNEFPMKFSELHISNDINNYEKLKSQNENLMILEGNNSLSGQSSSLSTSLPTNITTSTTTRSTSGENKIKINIKTTKEQLENLKSKTLNEKCILNNNGNSNSVELSQNMPNSKFKTDDIENNNKISESDAVPEVFKNDIIKLLDFPSGVANFNDKIPPFEIPPEIEKSNYFPLFISEVHNPYKFWFHFLKDGEIELDTLMNNIEHVYGDLDEKQLLMHVTNIRPGQICCAVFLKLWHRGEIVENPVDDKVKIFFVDYGTVSNVCIKNVKYLLKEFCELPGQAVRGSLSHIKPISHRWTRDATLCFLHMTSELMLYAKPVEVDHKENVVRMIIVDTNGQKEFQINEALIIKGHARYASDYPKSLNEKSKERKKHSQEKYPTFKMLEKGEYPSYTEIGFYLSQGIDFEKILDENILPDIEDEDIIDYTKKLISYSSTESSQTSTQNHLAQNAENEFYKTTNIKLPTVEENLELTTKIVPNVTNFNLNINDDNLFNKNHNSLLDNINYNTVQVPTSKKQKSTQCELSTSTNKEITGTTLMNTEQYKQQTCDNNSMFLPSLYLSNLDNSNLFK